MARFGNLWLIRKIWLNIYLCNLNFTETQNPFVYLLSTAALTQQGS